MEFKIDEVRLAHMFHDKAENEGEEVANLEMWGGESASLMLADLLADAFHISAIMAPSIGYPELGRVEAQIVIYGEDPSDCDGFILAVRPNTPVDWFPAGVQLATWWQDIDNYLPRRETGYLDYSEKGMREALAGIVVEANSLLPLLEKLAS